MFVHKCPCCSSTNVKKNGFHNGSQLYKCKQCGRQFVQSLTPSPDSIWNAYLEGKRTISELSEKYHISASTVKRLLRKKVLVWHQPILLGSSGYLHLDVTYWGHNWGVMLGIEASSGRVLYLSFIKHETTQAYKEALDAILTAGYGIKGIVVDGKRELFEVFKAYPIQMCQFHMLQIVKRHLTLHPKLIASRELQSLCKTMTYADAADFICKYETWKVRWHEFLCKRTIHKNGKSYYLHRRIRTLVKSIDFYMSYLFTFQRLECVGMPNTNNKIEGVFANLKRCLNNHNGLTSEHRKQFIIAYFQKKWLEQK